VDAAGTPQVGHGEITDRYAYTAFGESDPAGTSGDTSGSTENNYRYTGEQLDPNLGFYYLRARWVDPSTGRFTQQDTWRGSRRSPVTCHKYLYANADPVNGIDPSGHFTLIESMKAVGVVATLAVVGVGSYDFIATGRYHEYNADTMICQAVAMDDPCSEKNVFAGLRRFPAPFYLGDHEVQDNETKTLPFFGPVVHRVFEPNVVHNVALEGHLLYPGTVERSVVRRGSAMHVKTFGGKIWTKNLDSQDFRGIAARLAEAVSTSIKSRQIRVDCRSKPTRPGARGA
jgi:RHS repeat-associated protein